jgi:hypothetical protein
MDNKDDIYKKLITLLRLFKNRPYHLAKYLIDNSALSKDFIDNLLNSKKIVELSELDMDITKNFTSISQMEDFYTSLINDTDFKNDKEVQEKLNYKLNELIKNEKYEDAANLRDYMKRKGIKRI